MSMAPNNPFDQTNQQGPAPASESSPWMMILGIIGGVILICGLLCCGGIYYVYNEAATMINEEAVAEIQSEFGDDPAFSDKIGKVKTAEISISASAKEAKRLSESGDSDAPMIAFEIEGEKGSGTLVYLQDAETGSSSARLIMDDGEIVELEVDDESGEAPEDVDGLEGESPAEPSETDTPPESSATAPTGTSAAEPDTGSADEEATGGESL